ncbi:hypothetical protein B0H11DRAFT_1346900 [Mycena galericulata]|nr:hypothetical protein B0H11DRAFT_1346900 [Mycena galericulata]
MSSRDRGRSSSGFFSGCTNFTISGGTFNEIAGDLRQYSTQHFAVQYNNVSGHYMRYDSPTIVDIGRTGPSLVPNRGTSPAPNRSNTDPGARRGAGRGSYSGFRMAPYSSGRGSEQPPPQSPHSRTSRVPQAGRGGSVTSPFNRSSPASVPGQAPREHSQQSGLRNGFTNGSGRYNPWTYTPPQIPPSSPAASSGSRNSEPAEEDHSDTSDESDADSPRTRHSGDRVAPDGPSSIRGRDPRQSV